jgi:hypothetical protein
LWRHLKQYGRACGIRLNMDGDNIYLKFTPPIGLPDLQKFVDTGEI